jgi:pyruvate dehydrogenase E2 component (dihydrolipoamide acetyltransferase)
MLEFKMPSLGADMEAGVLVAWNKKPGDRVRRGDLIAEVETDKGIIEVEAFVDGVLEKLVMPVGEKVPVGTVLALIREDGMPPSATAVSAVQIETKSVPETRLTEPWHAETHATPVHEPTRLPMSPSARRLARELGVDPATVHGTGHGGAITREDIEHTARGIGFQPVVSIPPGASAKERQVENLPHERMRQAIAAAMARSKREIPHYYLSHTIDLQSAMNWLAEENLKRPITERLLYGVLLLKAVALALREVPELNSIWEGDRAVLKPSIHVGVAISLRQGGLIAPAIHDTDQKSLEQLMREFSDLVNRARSGGLRSSELSDPTITVTSLGERGVESVFGIIFPPQTAIVGFGKVVERPWSINGGLMSRQVITASLSADHRVSDGHRGGLFLSAVERLLQEPDKL